MIVTVSPEVEKTLIALAEQRSVDPCLLGGSLLEETMRERGWLGNNGDEDDAHLNPEALACAVRAMVGRTPEEVKAAQEAALRDSAAERELPTGRTIFDVIPGIRGDETDEQVLAALERLS